MSQDLGQVGAGESLIKRLATTTDGVGGLITLAVGVVAIIEGLRLGVGTLSRMGPGQSPILVGVVLVGLALLLLLKAGRHGGERASVPFEVPALLLLASLGIFAVLLPMVGMIPAAFVQLLLSSLAVTGRLRVSDVAFAAAFATLAAITFINGLGMVLPIIRWPF